MIQDAEFWAALSSHSPPTSLAKTLLVAALHRSMTSKRQVTVSIGVSPSARTHPTSASVTPTNGGNASSRGAQLTPVSSLHEPFLDGVSPRSSTPQSQRHNAGRSATPQGSRNCKSGGSTKQKSTSFFNPASLPVSDAVVRLLQHTMMFIVPLYVLRYRTPAMSMSWNAACVVDAQTQRLVTFGAASANVPEHLRCKACVAGDDYIAILTENDEVWVSGSLDCGNGSITAASADGSGLLDRNINMRGIAGKVLMIAGHGSRLIALTKALTVRPLSIVPVSTRTLMPSRLVRSVEVGLGDDCYMVGVDSVLYKTTVTHRNVTTPRRVMTLARLAVSRVASGSGFHLILDECGQVHSLGKNKRGQLGNGLKQDSMRRPYLIAALQHHFVIQVAAGESHSLVLTSSGDVYGCGSNEYGQLGLGADVADITVMTRVPLPAKCEGIAAGPQGSMFALRDGRLFTCGSNESQQLGLGASSSGQKFVVTPTAVSRSIVHAVAMSAIDFSSFQKADFGLTSPSADASFAQSLTATGGSGWPSTATTGNRTGSSSRHGARSGVQEKTNSLCRCCTTM